MATLEDDQAELENYPLWNWHRYAITVGKLFTTVPLSPNSIILVLVKGGCAWWLYRCRYGSDGK